MNENGASDTGSYGHIATLLLYGCEYDARRGAGRLLQKGIKVKGMEIREACEMVDHIKADRRYYPRAMRQAAMEAFESERMEARGRWRDGEMSLRAELNVSEVCAEAQAILKG